MDPGNSRSVVRAFPLLLRGRILAGPRAGGRRELPDGPVVRRDVDVGQPGA